MRSASMPRGSWSGNFRTTAAWLASARQLRQLYGEAAEATSVTLAGWSFELDNQLSPGAQLRLTEMVRVAREIIASYRAKNSQRSTVNAE